MLRTLVTHVSGRSATGMEPEGFSRIKQPCRVIYAGAKGTANMEREAEEDRLDIAHRLFDALCAGLPGRSLMLLDECGCVVASNDRPNMPSSPLVN
jgi:hypothetical protein